MNEFYWIAVAVVTVVSSSRITRLLTWDKFPPVLHVRDVYAEWTDKTDRRREWQVLAFCGYCMSFWVTAFVVLWGLLSGVFDDTARGSALATDIWWYSNGILAASYLAALFMAHDGDDGDDD